MSRVQLALNVNDIDEAVTFYTKLFGAEPAKRRPGYANFAISEPPLKLVLLENAGQGGSLNHLGVEVPDIDTVDAEQTRLAEAGLVSVDERDTTCCYAKQDKFWVQGTPNGESWEFYTVLADSQTFYGEEPVQRLRRARTALLRYRRGPLWSWASPITPRTSQRRHSAALLTAVVPRSAMSLTYRAGRAWPAACGRMFWLNRNRLPGSEACLTAARRA